MATYWEKKWHGKYINNIIMVYSFGIINHASLHCQVLLWEVTQNGIELASLFPLQSHPCFEVAGQINSIDAHGEYAAVGSAVIQLVKLTDFALNKRILVHKSMKSISMVLEILIDGRVN